MSRHFPAYAHAAARPRARAASVDGQALTWEALLGQTADLGAAWKAHTDPKRPVLLPAHRSLRFLLHFTALMRAGRPVVLVNPGAVADECAHIRRVTGATGDLARDTWDRMEEHASAADTTADEAAAWSADRVLFTVMTSGTTGHPRAVQVTCEQAIFSTLGSAARLGSLPADVWHAPLPLHHVGGIMVFVRALILGFEAEYTSTFDAEYSAQRLQSGEVTMASFVPVMLRRILEATPRFQCPSTLRAVLLGGAATPDAVLQHAQKCGLPIARSWGMSETTSQIATAQPGDFESDLAPLPFAKIHAGNDGALYIDGPQATGGGLQTTDRGTVDAGGVRIEGRLDDLFISGGENIDPLEIQRVLLTHPDIADALVAGAPSEQWGREIIAFVVYKATPQPDALRAYCKKVLAAYKIPRVFHVVQDIPRNALGKPSRRRAVSIHAHGKTVNPTHPSSVPDVPSGATS